MMVNSKVSLKISTKTPVYQVRKIPYFFSIPFIVGWTFFMKLLTGDVLLKIPNSNPFHTPLIYCAVKSCPWIIDVWIPLTGGFYCGIYF